jgi:DsbC/DsbD-like thiol-disulfide interchange protein
MKNWCLTCLIAATSAIGPAFSQVPDNIAVAEIEHGWREDDGTHVAGLTINLAPGWKTYWRAPGDSGIPPVFNWSGSQNVADVSVQFPVPEVFMQNGLRSIGYKDTVTFPLWIATRDAGAPIRLRGEIELGVCEEICVPMTLQVGVELPASGVRNGRIARVVEDRPVLGGAMRCEIEPIDDGLRVTAVTGLRPMAGTEVAVIESGESGLWISEPVVTRNGDTLSATVEMVPPDARPFALARSDVRLTVFAGGRAVEMLGCD